MIRVSNREKALRLGAPPADIQVMPWWAWGLIAWTGLAVAVALLLGRGIAEADCRELRPGGGIPALPTDVPHLAAHTRPRRRRVPLPPVAVALAVVGLSLEAVGFVLRTAGDDRGGARLLSMDLPLSLPRMYIAALFAAAALAAGLGSARIPGRRTWWTAVAVVAAGIGSVKAGGDVHVLFLRAIGGYSHPARGLLVSGAISLAVVGWLWWLSRHEQRDRRRVLTALGLYAGASVGLSAISSLAANTWGSYAGAAATFFEESGEALAGVVFLFAVLVGVAPRLVLPRAWALRRDVDEHTLDVVDPVPAWRPLEDGR